MLSRERPKESTLDFADRRGFDGESVVRRWIEYGRARVAELGDRIQRTMEVMREKQAQERPVSAQDRQRAERLAKIEVDQFKALAVKRKAGFSGYSDRSPGAWKAVPAEQRERIERFNALPKERQAIEMQKMQRVLADQYARDSHESMRNSQQQREQE